jgi:hypothetical protein
MVSPDEFTPADSDDIRMTALVLLERIVRVATPMDLAPSSLEPDLHCDFTQMSFSRRPDPPSLRLQHG